MRVGGSIGGNGGGKNLLVLAELRSPLVMFIELELGGLVALKLRSPTNGDVGGVW